MIVSGDLLLSVIFLIFGIGFAINNVELFTALSGILAVVFFGFWLKDRRSKGDGK